MFNFSPTSDGGAAAIVCSEDFVKKHNLQHKAIEIIGMEMATDLPSTFKDKSSMKIVSWKPNPYLLDFYALFLKLL